MVNKRNLIYGGIVGAASLAIYLGTPSDVSNIPPKNNTRSSNLTSRTNEPLGELNENRYNEIHVYEKGQGLDGVYGWTIDDIDSGRNTENAIYISSNSTYRKIDDQFELLKIEDPKSLDSLIKEYDKNPITAKDLYENYPFGLTPDDKVKNAVKYEIEHQRKKKILQMYENKEDEQGEERDVSDSEEKGLFETISSVIDDIKDNPKSDEPYDLKKLPNDAKEVSKTIGNIYHQIKK